MTDGLCFKVKSELFLNKKNKVIMGKLPNIKKYKEKFQYTEK